MARRKNSTSPRRRNRSAKNSQKSKNKTSRPPRPTRNSSKTSKFTQEDVNKRVELQILSTAIQTAVTAEAGVPSSSEISDYYNAAKATQFTTKPSRDVRILVNKDKAEVEAAKKALEADNSPASWKVVAAKYSSDPTSKTKGGLQKGIQRRTPGDTGPLQGAIFDSATGEIVGPVKFQGSYTLVEVVKLNPAKVQTLAEAQAADQRPS